MWCSHYTHKAWLPLRRSLSALRPHPQLPLWSVMGLLRSTSSILITGQNPLNGIWFAMKGRGRAVSHWTRLSLETSIPPHPHPLHPRLQVEAGMSILPCITSTCGVAGCVYVCVGEGVHRQRRQSSSAMKDTVCGLSEHEAQHAQWS